MIVAITGAKGLLGQYLLKTQPNKVEGVIDPVVVPCDRQMFDVSNFAKMLEVFFRIKPDIIIHCAANGDVDSVERHSRDAVKSDLLGTVNLTEYAEATRTKLITISTNAVYNGLDNPYKANDFHNPVSFYGKIKSLADYMVQKSTCQWLIIRPIFLYGWGTVRDNWVTKLIKGGTFKLVDDINTHPTYAGDVARFIWHLIEKDEWRKSYNVCGPEVMSIYEVGEKVKKRFPNIEIERAKLADFDTIAPRPNSTIFNRKEIEYFDFCTLDEGLRKMKNET